MLAHLARMIRDTGRTLQVHHRVLICKMINIDATDKFGSKRGNKNICRSPASDLDIKHPHQSTSISLGSFIVYGKYLSNAWPEHWLLRDMTT
jgi:hypothetical protein